MTQADVSSWRTPVASRTICLHSNLESHVVTVQPPEPVLFLDNLSLPYADESLTTTPADPPPSTSGCHISISGQSEWSIDEATSTGSAGIATPASDVTPPPTSDLDDESRDRVGSLVTSYPVAVAPTGSGGETATTTESTAPVYRPSTVTESLRRCEPTHFHWTSTSTSTSARPRPSLRPAVVDSMILSSLVSSPLICVIIIIIIIIIIILSLIHI